MDCLLLIWHTEIFIPVRIMEDYSDEAHQPAIAAAIEFSKTLQETVSLIMTALKVRMTMGMLWTLQKPRLSPTISYKRFLSVQPFTGLVKCWMIHSFVFVHAPLLPNHGGKKWKYQFILIMDARPGAWIPCNSWIIWKKKEFLLTRHYKCILTKWPLSNLVGNSDLWFQFLEPPL